MSRKRHPDPLTIAYLAIGAIDAWNAATDGQREHASDTYSGQLGYVGEVIAHADALDALWRKMEDGPGVFEYEVAEPFGIEYGQALLRDTPRPDPREFYEALVARDRVERGL